MATDELSVFSSKNWNYCMRYKSMDVSGTFQWFWLTIYGSFCSLLFRSHLWGGNYILKWIFFVQTILADRYMHRREMWVVSWKSSSSVEFRIKKIFLNFVFFEELSRFKVLCDDVMFGHDFVHFRSNWDFFLLKYQFKIAFNATNETILCF